MLTLDEAIKHCEEKAEENKKAASRFAYPDKAGTTKESADCLECANEHAQLAEWLKELKVLKERPQVTVFAENASKEEIEDFKQELENVLKRPQSEWIPVSERLPNRNGCYNVTRIIEGTRLTDVCYFDGQNTWHRDTGVNHGRPYLSDIIAWQPLPEPYKKGGAE